MIPRLINGTLKERLGKGMAIVLLGPRQVGKTTMLLDILDKGKAGVYLD